MKRFIHTKIKVPENLGAFVKTVNDVTEDQQSEYRYHYAALYPLYINAKASPIEGQARLWVHTRWDPQRGLNDAEYESLTLEIQSKDNDLKLEAWVFGDRLIIIITNSNLSGTSGLHPSKNYHIDLKDPNSIPTAVMLVDRYIHDGQKIDNEELPRLNTKVFYYCGATTIAIIILRTLWILFNEYR